MKKKEFTLGDNIFAITVVSLMCLVIISIPILCFYFAMYMVSLSSDITIISDSNWSLFKVVIKFFLTTIVVTGIVDTIFSQLLDLKKGIFGFISEFLLMYAFFYLYTLIYTRISTDIMVKDAGYFYIATFLFVLFILIHVVHFLTKRMYSNMMNNIKKKHN